MTLWNKGTQAADWVTRFTVGEDHVWDTYLLPYDVAASRVQAAALETAGILTADEVSAINEAFDDLVARYERGEVSVEATDEDCHTVLERFLTERLGETGRKIHTGRSRNDQVLLALRLFLRDRMRDAGRSAASIIRTMCDLAEGNDDVLMPGYTHFQPAMPQTPGLWAAGYAELLLWDLATLQHTAASVDLAPSGSAAGYGVPVVDLPRDEMASSLGFGGLQRHVTSVQLSRGKFELAVMHAFVQLAGTINRLASDLVIFNSAEFRFVTLPAEYCTGSSIMPQKRNPDVLELARASYHRLLGELNVLLTLPANLPSGYHRDLQLTKEAVMRGTLRTLDLLEAIDRVMPGVKFDRERITVALSGDLFATEEALKLVSTGTPFRDAYREAASRLDTIGVPSTADALAAYHTAGAPGQVRPDELRRRLAELEASFLNQPSQDQSSSFFRKS
jgi:argininosuccinate lyase